MSAVDTALRVLTWAATEEMNPAGAPPPHGDLAAAGELATPPPDVRLAVGRLAALSAARARLAMPPLGDERPPGIGPALLAAALGARDDLAAARTMLAAAAECGAPTAYDLAARHGVARQGVRLRDADPGVADLLRDRSPLTAVLDAPAPGGEYAAEDLLVGPLMGHPDGQRLLTCAFAEPAADVRVAVWRSDRLSWLRQRTQHLQFVLDVYEWGLALFGREHRRRVRQAQALLSSTAGRPDVAAARPLIIWWRALSEIERTWPAEIRRRHLITAGYIEGVRTYRRLRAAEGAQAA